MKRSFGKLKGTGDMGGIIIEKKGPVEVAGFIRGTGDLAHVKEGLASRGKKMGIN